MSRTSTEKAVGHILLLTIATSLMGVCIALVLSFPVSLLFTKIFSTDMIFLMRIFTVLQVGISSLIAAFLFSSFSECRMLTSCIVTACTYGLILMILSLICNGSDLSFGWFSVEFTVALIGSFVGAYIRMVKRV